MDDSIFGGETARVWHVSWQATAGRDFLCDRSLAARIRGRLLQAHRREGRCLLYFLLMPTEIHLLSILADGESPGDLARGLANVVARWVRDADGLPGPVFAGRFRERPIQGLDALRREVRLLAWRPVDLKLCVAASHFRHGALRVALGLSRSEGFQSTSLLEIFGTSVQDARRALRAWLAMRPSIEEVARWELSHGLRLAPGSMGPVGRMARQVRGPAAALVAASEGQGIDGALRLLEGWVEVKLGLQTGQGLLQYGGESAARGRALVAKLAVKLGLCSAAAVARHFGRAKSTLSEKMAESQKRPADQMILAVPMSQVVREAISLAYSGTQSRTS